MNSRQDHPPVSERALRDGRRAVGYLATGLAPAAKLRAVFPE